MALAAAFGVVFWTTSCAGGDEGEALHPAARALGEFLDRATITRGPLSFETVMACVPDGQADRNLTLATHRVLPTSLQGDTTGVAAEIVTVAEEVGDPGAVGRYVASLRTQTDTLHWRVVRREGGSEWGVCGYAIEGYSFGHYGGDSNTTWQPLDASWAQALAIADSLQRSSQGSPR